MASRAVGLDRSPPGVAAEALRPPVSLLIAITLGAFLGMADATVVAVALAPLSARFGVGAAAAQETLGIYLITVTATLPTLGRLSDRFGRNRAYAGGFAIFIAGSVMAVFAPSFVSLLGARAVQAVGGGMLTSGSLALIAEHAPRRRTGRSVALLVVTQAVAGLVGPPVGGVLVALWGWQAVFWAGIPIALLGIALTVRFVPGTRDFGALRAPDVPGALLLALLLLGLATGTASLGGPIPGGLPAGAWYGLAVVSAVGLVPAERRARAPMLDGRLLGARRFRRATLATFLSTGTLMSCFAVLPFWLEQGHGASAVLAGAAFLPISLGLAVTSRHGGRMGDAGATRGATMAGMALAALGLAVAAAAALSAEWPLLMVGLLLLGCGNGLFSAPNTAAAMSVAPRTALGSAAGLLSTARNAGVVTGLGITGAVYGAMTRTAGGHAAADRAASTIFGVAALVCLAVATLTRSTYSGEPGPRDA